MATLPHPLQSRLEHAARAYFEPPSGMDVDFTAPAGEPALFAPDSVSWRVMKNPVALLVGGIAAVILELAEPRVRSGVWEHTSFRRDPVTRMKRTGFAAMVTVYAPASAARGLITNVVRAHDRIEGVTPGGAPYRANDPDLLRWVHATAAYGFVEAYHRFARPLSAEERDRFYNEGAETAALYGAIDAPTSAAALDTLFARTRPQLERSAIVHDLLDIVRAAPILPSRALQALIVRAAIDITPAWARELLSLPASAGLSATSRAIVRTLGAAADRLVIARAPPAQACSRLGLPAYHVYR